MPVDRSAFRAFFANSPIFRIPPGFCLLCDEPARTIANLCDRCARSLPLITDPCRRCGAWAMPGTDLCRLCAIRAPTVSQTICALAYSSPVNHLIGRLKFGHDLRVAPTLAGLLKKHCEKRIDKVDWLLPVPLGLPRLRSRGFNQALEIARELKLDRTIPMASFVYRKATSNAPQSSLPTLGARRANVRDAFEVRDHLHGRVAIIDDVVTTGATVNALADCLLRAGAREVEVWAVARTP
ncbi:MAG: ComF family protein [Ectothiorhodospiraceae bacterium AqS1]|nr:ComF family protein [Ectothiorhodospiraceae bacterium AqS1]